jgi:1,4-dihydroxy-2-naphthoyl-CoA hydrolase
MSVSVWRRAVTLDLLQRGNVANVGKNMLGHLGLKFTGVGHDWLEATMPVDERTVQPFGILHGGASVVLAETLGSYASYLATAEDNKSVVGVDISATHLRAVKHGSSVTGRATPLKLGKRLHVWEIKIHETGKESFGPTCVSRLTVMITDLPKKPTV